MNIKSVAIGAALTAMVGIGLTACGSNAAAPDSPEGKYRVGQVNVNGQDLTCVSWKKGYAGGMSCNWEAYNSK